MGVRIWGAASPMLVKREWQRVQRAMGEASMAGSPLLGFRAPVISTVDCRCFAPAGPPYRDCSGP